MALFGGLVDVVLLGIGVDDVVDGVRSLADGAGRSYSCRSGQTRDTSSDASNDVRDLFFLGLVCLKSLMGELRVRMRLSSQQGGTGPTLLLFGFCLFLLLLLLSLRGDGWF